DLSLRNFEQFPRVYRTRSLIVGFLLLDHMLLNNFVKTSLVMKFTSGDNEKVNG
ncbi:hypothetical protein GWI33_017378, partial [Rhynchophorus ferrugineus]